MDAPDTTIIVEGYSQRYAAVVKELLRTEGGHVNDPADRGGETNFGISLRFLKSEGAFDENGDGLAEFDLDLDGDIDGADIRKLKRGDAVALYHRCFWERERCDSWPRPIGEVLFDQAVNGGALAGRKLLQKAVNKCLAKVPGDRPAPEPLAIDGQLGTMTRMAVDWVLQRPSLGMPALIECYREAVRERYRAIVAANPSQKRFLRGWLARAERLGR